MTLEKLPWASRNRRREARNVAAGKEVRGGVSGRQRGGHWVTRPSARGGPPFAVPQFPGLPSLRKSHRILPPVVGSGQLDAPGSRLGVTPVGRRTRLLLLELLQVLRGELTWRRRERGKAPQGQGGKEKRRGHQMPPPAHFPHTAQFGGGGGGRHPFAQDHPPLRKPRRVASALQSPQFGGITRLSQGVPWCRMRLLGRSGDSVPTELSATGASDCAGVLPLEGAVAGRKSHWSWVEGKGCQSLPLLEGSQSLPSPNHRAKGLRGGLYLVVEQDLFLQLDSTELAREQEAVLDARLEREGLSAAPRTTAGQLSPQAAETVCRGDQVAPLAEGGQGTGWVAACLL